MRLSGARRRRSSIRLLHDADKKINKGNLVNRIGLARRKTIIAWVICFFVGVVAVEGWIRPVKKVIAERPIGLSNSDCMQYAREMCQS